jgi:hypothetical protein
MRSLGFLVAALVVTTGINGVSAGEPALDWAAPLSGAWTLAGATEGAPYCQLTLGSSGVIGGASITVSATCRRNFPLEDVAGWTLRNGNLVLIDTLKNAVVTFSPVSDGAFTASFPSGEQVFLERGQPARPESLRALLDGSFTLSGPNNAEPCGFYVSSRSEEAGEIEQSGACATTWKPRKWHSWRFAKGELHLLANDGSTILSLTPADSHTFAVEAADGPIFFGPGVIVADD